MTFNPGRNIGRLSIRVVPDTTKFRKDLVKRLETIARTTKMTVNVNKAKLDNAAIREDIRRQLATFKGLDADVSVRVTVDRARLQKKTLRKSIQQQFDQFDDIRVKIAAEIQNAEQFQKQVRDMTDRASKNRVNIHASAVTLDASAQLKWVTRDRIVNIFARVSKASVVSSLTTLAALSGARLSWKWIDSLAESMKNLDRALPSIVGWTSGITSMVAAVFSATSGLVGIGQGLVSITPAFLVIPGLLLNALGSATALIVALRNAGTELAPLKNDMQELGDIINETFWGRARQPILDLVTGLMPQLRNSFRDISEGIGDFTAALSNAFAVELSGGRMESIFKGIADGWRILSTGAPAFAGAMTSLSQIAATYTPRLASWFVRQADTFDNWLNAIASDGRLGEWMETAIDSMYDLWDVTRGVAGVFEGLWKAAEAAGSKGLAGFADSMLKWERVVKGADFQRGMTAVFRGSNTAMSSFGDAFKSIGRLIADLDKTTERFIGSAGKFFGGLIDASAFALNTPQFGRGVDDFSAGLLRALEGIKPSLQPIADTFGNFLGLLGDLAGTVLPTATSVLAALMPSIDGIIAEIRPILPYLADGITKFAETVGPALSDFVDEAMPVVGVLLSAASELLVGVAPALRDIVIMLSELIAGLSDLLGLDPEAMARKGEFDRSGFAPNPEDYANPFEYIKEYKEAAQKWMDENKLIVSSEFTPPDGTSAKAIAEGYVDRLRTTFETEGQSAAHALWSKINATGMKPEVREELMRQLGGWAEKVIPPEGYAAPIIPKIQFKPGLENELKSEADRVTNALRTSFESGGLTAAQALWDKMAAPLPSEMRSQILWDVQQLGIDIEASAGGAGGGFSRGLASGMTIAYPALDQAVSGARDTVTSALSGASTWLGPGGAAVVQGFAEGAISQWDTVSAWFATTFPGIATLFADAISWLRVQGTQTVAGFHSGLGEGWASVAEWLGGIRTAVTSPLADAGGWLWSSGRSVVQGFIGGLNSMWNNLRNAASNIMSVVADFFPHSPAKRGPFSGAGWTRVETSGAALGEQFTDGLRRSMSSSMPNAMRAGQVRASMVPVAGLSRGPGHTQQASGSGEGRAVVLNIHNPTVRDLKSDAREAADMAGVMLG